jgi:6-phosphogluconolactonase
MEVPMRTMRRAVLGGALALAALGAVAGPAAAAGKNAVYTESNSASGNRILVFDRAGNGSLRPAESVPTGELGTGSGLGSQGALALTRGGQSLYAVNAGSDTISSFAVGPHGLRFTGTAPSGGDQPISLTTRRGLLYALNAGNGTISGFRIAHDGSLNALPGSTAPIAGSGPAEVAFSTGGNVLAVTDKNTNTIDTFTVGSNGLPGPVLSQPSEGQTPFGFEFDKRGHLIVSEAFGGAPGASAVSSYSVASDGALSTISASIPDGQAAACWISVTKNGRFAYTTNTGSGSISSYSVGYDGSLGLLEQNAAATGAGSSPADMAQSEGGRALFALAPGIGSIGAFRVAGNGGLSPVDQVGGVPASASGLVAR